MSRCITWCLMLMRVVCASVLLLVIMILVMRAISEQWRYFDAMVVLAHNLLKWGEGWRQSLLWVVRQVAIQSSKSAGSWDVRARYNPDHTRRHVACAQPRNLDHALRPKSPISTITHLTLPLDCDVIWFYLCDIQLCVLSLSHIFLLFLCLST